MPTADTSWLYALMDEQDAHHDRALQTTEQHSQIDVHVLALAEVLHLIRIRARKLYGQTPALQAERATRKALLAVGGLRFCTELDLTRSAAIHDRHRPLSFADAALVAHAIGSGQELLSFDARQLAAWKHEKAT